MARTCVYDSCLAGVVNTVLDIAAHQEIDGLFNHSQWQHKPLSWFYLAAKPIFQSDINLCVSEEDVKQVLQLAHMRDSGVTLVVSKQLKESSYLDVTNVVSFEDFFLDTLDPAMARWRRNGVVSD